ncbi:MAG: hypothetical protein A2Y94_10375 [Caldithrix sp. RBG_13_44_9]|nr:MAG: hypothetical protein A2Y94_10375 [Caldithrix sp. RBG_13_44_9]
MKLGVASVFLSMFLRKLKNRSGSTSVQIISKAQGQYNVIKTMGLSFSQQQIAKLWKESSTKKDQTCHPERQQN